MTLSDEAETIKKLMAIEEKMKHAREEIKKHLDDIKKLEKDGHEVINNATWQDDRIKLSSQQRIVQHAVRTLDESRGLFKFLNISMAAEDLRKVR